VIKTVFIYFCV